MIAALTRLMEAGHGAFVEAIPADSLNIYDVILWAEKAGHHLLTRRKDSDGTTRVPIQPNGKHKVFRQFCFGVRPAA